MNNYKNRPDDELVSDARRPAESMSALTEMMRRLKDSIERLDENSAKYSRVITVFTIAMLSIAALEFVMPYSQPMSVVRIISVVAIIIFIIVVLFSSGILRKN